MKTGINCGAGILNQKHSTDEIKWYDLDIRKFPGIDIVVDLGQDKIPFAKDTIDEMEAVNILEHFTSEQLFHFMDEAFRVLKPTGKLFVAVPIWGTQAWLIHPEHKMHWTKDMISFFLPPADGNDPHGYLKGFWHFDIISTEHPEHLQIMFYPNKPGGRYEYKEIKSVYDNSR